MIPTVALIGCGRIGSLLEDDPLRAKPASHMGGIQRLGDRVRLVAVCDTDRQRLVDCQNRWRVEKIYLDYREMIWNEKPQVVIIATWTASHRDIAVYAAENGVRGLVLEKPMAVDLQQADEILYACRRHNVKLVVNHERRWDSRYIQVRRWIEEERLGPLRTIHATVLSRSALEGSWKSVLEEVGGGPLLHDGTHLLDMVHYFCGEIEEVSGKVYREHPTVGVETTALGLLRSRDGVNVFVEAGGMRDYFHFEMDLQFARGRIKVGNGIEEFAESRPSTRYSGFQDLQSERFIAADCQCSPFPGALEEALQAVALDLREEEIHSSGRDARRAMETIFAVYYSAFLGGKVVRLPLQIGGHPLKKLFASGKL